MFEHIKLQMVSNRDKKAVLNVEIAGLRKLIDHALFAASHDEHRVLHGVLRAQKHCVEHGFSNPHNHIVP
jgi:hypothetical protein